MGSEEIPGRLHPTTQEGHRREGRGRRQRTAGAKRQSEAGHKCCGSGRDLEKEHRREFWQGKEEGGRQRPSSQAEKSGVVQLEIRKLPGRGRPFQNQRKFVVTNRRAPVYY